jgi:hypothetical protein
MTKAKRTIKQQIELQSRLLICIKYHSPFAINFFDQGCNWTQLFAIKMLLQYNLLKIGLSQRRKGKRERQK